MVSKLQHCLLAPSTPRNLSVVAVPEPLADGQQSVRVSWSSPLQPNGRVREYKVSWSGSARSDSIIVNESAWNYFTIAGSQWNFTIGNLRACSAVNVSVRAATCDGCWSNMALASAKNFCQSCVSRSTVNIVIRLKLQIKSFLHPYFSTFRCRAS